MLIKSAPGMCTGPVRAGQGPVKRQGRSRNVVISCQIANVQWTGGAALPTGVGYTLSNQVSGEFLLYEFLGSDLVSRRKELFVSGRARRTHIDSETCARSASTHRARPLPRMRTFHMHDRRCAALSDSALGHMCAHAPCPYSCLWAPAPVPYEYPMSTL